MYILPLFVFKENIMTVMVTGAEGMLGLCVLELLSKKRINAIPIDFKSQHGAINADICNAEQMFSTIEKTKPDFIIHTAAQTNVDLISRDKSRGYKVNSWGTNVLAAAAANFDIPIIYISTDYVFDGTRTEPYNEFNTPRPINEYGRSKLEGEKVIRDLCKKFFIVRTSGLFAPHGKNFPLTIMENARKLKELKVVSDQVFSPTYAYDLAEYLISLLDSKIYGVYHFCNSGQCSWYEFAKYILETAGIKDCKLHPITSREYPTPTSRPAFSVLRRYKLELQGKDNVRSWQEAVNEFIDKTGVKNL